MTEAEPLPTVPELCKNFKDDLSQVSELSFEDRKRHLEFVSKPLLRLAFQSLTQQKKELPESQVSILTEYLIQYLSYDRFISVDALMSLFRLKSLNDNLESILEEKIDNLVEVQNSKADICRIFKIVSQLFSFDAVLSSAIFTKKTSFITLLTNEITLLTNEINSINIELIKQLNVILVLFSNACVDEFSRSIIATMYTTILLKCLTLADSQAAQTRCYAATIAVKSWRMFKPETLDNNSKVLSLDNLSDILIESLYQGLETSVEGLSLLCTNVQIKNKVRDIKVLDTLFALMKSKEHTVYGILSILSLITLPNRLIKLQQRSVLSLKDSNSISNINIYTNEKISSNQINDDVNNIQLVNKEIIKRKLFTNHIISIFKSLESSKGLVGQCLRLMYNITFPDIDLSAGTNSPSASDKEYHNTYLTQIKEIIKLTTAYLIGTSQNLKYNHESFISFVDGNSNIPEDDLELRSIAIKLLCSPEISGNIEEIYGNDNEELALSPVPFILEILVQHDIDTGCSLGSKQTPFSSLKNQIFSAFDVYYAFVSLAATCSLSYPQVKQSVFTLGFDSIINALNSSDEKLQFSSLQCLNEICDIPLCIAKIFNWKDTNDDHYQNFSILCHLLQSNNYDSQCLVLQIFYSVSNYDLVVEKLCSSELFCSNLNKIFQNQDSDDALIYYALLVLTHLFSMKDKNVDSDYLQVFDESRDIILKHIQSDNDQIKESAIAVAQYM